MLFGGNLLRQPVFVNLRKENPAVFRIRGLSSKENASLDSRAINTLLPGADEIMEQAIFLGVYPGLSQAQLDYVVQSVRDFVGRHTCV
jgi:CDP-6-deoxy-D-xylo-4-hexulose-3-dehydrase